MSYFLNKGQPTKPYDYCIKDAYLVMDKKVTLNAPKSLLLLPITHKSSCDLGPITVAYKQEYMHLN